MDWLSQPSDIRWWGSLLAVFLVSAAATALGIHYARRRNLIDHPGQRRSHAQPTPRGGGIGLVTAVLMLFAAEMIILPREALPDLFACWIALALVAAVGWIDDHRGLGAGWRILAHALAALIVVGGMLGAAVSANSPASGAPAITYAIALVFIVLSLVWSINLHNFMDGIDGLLGWQALFVFLMLATLMGGAGADADAWHLSAAAAAVAAFIPFNSPRARVFMGDVGSGTLGLLIGISVLRQLTVSEVEPFSGLIACSAFVVDASCNLVSRMLRGKRWYSAHREHLYQWMVRAGMSHARVVVWYMGWNLFIVVPVVWQLNRTWSTQPPGGHGVLGGLEWAAAVYGFGVALWIFGKRWCLRRARTRYADATA
jgi:UDP-N-acetylmuramyl pentapeptide phosphotransferase/UDP-N-acetylglucosamine-1-phosphate transferase